MALQKVGGKALLAAEKRDSKTLKVKQQTILDEDKYAEASLYLIPFVYKPYYRSLRIRSIYQAWDNNDTITNYYKC